MDNPKQKRFSLIDAMVLVAATAVGLALGRTVCRQPEPGSHFLADLVEWGVSVALTWSIAILALNLTRYRTTRRELACRPGFTAVVTICIDRVLEFVFYALPLGPFGGLIDVDFQSLDSVASWLMQLISASVTNVVPGGSSNGIVAAVWLSTGMAGCWRAENSWIDRTGRALGVFWLLITPGYWLMVWVSSF